MVGFSLPILLSLVAACGIMMLLEWRGLPTTLSLHFKGDIKRESRWLAQYGQAICTVVAGVLVWQLEGPGDRRGLAVPVMAGPFGTTIVATVLKKLFSRVRPGRSNAGRFLGPTLGRGNYKESFPSSHSACAMALSTVLMVLYPRAAITFWALAIGCAGLRYLLDAHWPSDVLGGLALGYGLGYVTLWACQIT